jgi:hypothetical protein
MKITNAQYVSTASRLYQNYGEIEVDDNAKVSRGADDGAYVQAWVWVGNEDIEQ